MGRFSLGSLHCLYAIGERQLHFEGVGANHVTKQLRFG